ncbi:hypothetical protein J6590_014580 [Homalodisca vitripennis]|nr:hypothetical protein J6590_014580 [Homalodisca vitripennis]
MKRSKPVKSHIPEGGHAALIANHINPQIVLAARRARAAATGVVLPESGPHYLLQYKLPFFRTSSLPRFGLAVIKKR